MIITVRRPRTDVFEALVIVVARQSTRFAETGEQWLIIVGVVTGTATVNRLKTFPEDPSPQWNRLSVC
jgi:hypothetical protein